MEKDKVSLNLNSNNYGVIIGEVKGKNAKTVLFESFRNIKQNANMCVLGVPGEGMSFNKRIDNLPNTPIKNTAEIIVKYQAGMDRSASEEGNTIIIDPTGEGAYKNLIECLSGKMIKIDPTNCSFINPLEIIDSKTNKYNKLVHKSQKLLNEKKYKKAYKVMAKMKKLEI